MAESYYSARSRCDRSEGTRADRVDVADSYALDADVLDLVPCLFLFSYRAAEIAELLSVSVGDLDHDGLRRRLLGSRSSSLGSSSVAAFGPFPPRSGA